MLDRARDAVGGAHTVAAFAALESARQRLILGWLALIETITRKLLFAEAASLVCAERAAAARGPRIELVPLKRNAIRLIDSPSPDEGAACSPGPINAVIRDHAAPESWRVSFALKPPLNRCKNAPRIRALWGAAPARQTPPSRTECSETPAPLRLAMRFEALRRVLADPAPHIRRLARLLPRLCRHNAYAATRYASEAARPYHSDERDPRLIIDAMALALAAAHVFFDSS